MTYEPITEITNEVLAMRWHSDAAARMWFTRRSCAPGRLGLSIIEDGGAYRVTRKAAPVRKRPEPQPPTGYEAWAIEVDALLIDAAEPAETESVLQTLYAEDVDAGLAAQRIINCRARGVPVVLSPKSTPAALPPPVVGDTLADQAAAPHADSKPVVPVVAPRNEVVLQLITTEDMAPIVARRLSQITGASVGWSGNRVDAPSESDGSSRR